MNSEIRYLDAFYQAARLLSFTKAANELGIAVSAVSRQIKLLEQHLGTELFVRGTRSIVLTDSGQTYSLMCKQFFEALKNAKQAKSTPQLKLGLLQSSFEALMKSGFSEFIRSHDGDIEFTINSPKRLVELLRDRQIDLTLSNEPSFLPGFKAIDLYREHLVWVVAAKQKMTLKPPLFLPSTRFIVCTPFERYWQRQTSVQPQNIIRINSVNGALELVRNGLGVSLIPADLVKNSKEFEIFPIKDVFETIYLNTLNTFEPTPAFKSLYQFLRLNMKKTGSAK